tara:strand:- start:8438 stop:8863 length:426 start_codon:yes stop_codon:yes gene_type:complete
LVTRKNIKNKLFNNGYMVSIVIFIIISLMIIIVVECISYILSNTVSNISNVAKEVIAPSLKRDTLSKNLLDKYITDSDIQIDHLPGKLFIENSDNIFIKINNNIILPENKIVYILETPFTLEIINLKNSDINYFYKKIDTI